MCYFYLAHHSSSISFSFLVFTSCNDLVVVVDQQRSNSSQLDRSELLRLVLEDLVIIACFLVVIFHLYVVVIKVVVQVLETFVVQL